MNFEMNNLEALEQLSEVQKAQQMEMEPPKLEKIEIAEQGTQNEEHPPKLERGTTLGESRDVFNARKAFEASTNSIEAKNRAEDLKEAIEEEARKKEEYREKLYGK